MTVTTSSPAPPLVIDPAARPSPSFLAGGPKQLLIGGQFLPAMSGETIPTIDPTTEQVLTSVASAGPADVDHAVSAARRAFEDPSWSAITPYDRSLVLLQIADVIEAHAEELATLDSLDMGSTIATTRALTANAVETFRYFAGWPTKMTGITGPTTPGHIDYTLRTPLGVIGAIIGWNGPMLALGWKLAPALATGNTVVLKPAEGSPLSALRVGELLAETDLPPGVVNIVTGSGGTAGEHLVNHPGVAKIAFTGSTAVGKRILAASSRDLKHVTLELGGKSPTIVYDDADLPAAAATAAVGFLAGSGQGCVMGTRIFVQDGVREEFTHLLDQAMARFTVGDPFHPDATMGPLASRQQYERVVEYFDVARQDGARLALGGQHGPDTGLFVYPTLFDGVSNDMRVAQEEIFGPIAVVMPFTDTEDAVRLGNDTVYGLAASVWTKDLARAHRTAAALQAGTVWVNTFGVLRPELPFGGFKQSGLGRENGAQVIDEYTQTKTVLLSI